MSEEKPKPGTRPQQGGEAETTRFGMEAGDNTDVPATSGSQQEEAEPSPPAGEDDTRHTQAG